MSFTAFPDLANELVEKLKARKIDYYLYDHQWLKNDPKSLGLDMSKWVTIKYLNDTGGAFNSDIGLIPKDTGGLYLFSINCPVIPGSTEFPVYVGRAQLTSGQNLRKRCREYFNNYKGGREKRVRIRKMFRHWSKYLFLSFYPMTDNSDIIKFEKILIESFLFPFNDDVPEDVVLREAKKAF